MRDSARIRGAAADLSGLSEKNGRPAKVFDEKSYGFYIARFHRSSRYLSGSPINPPMSAHVVFRSVSPAFQEALNYWLQSHQPAAFSRSVDSNVELETNEETLVALLSVVKGTGSGKAEASLRDFYLAVFALDDERCEFVNGRFALEETQLHQALPAMASTPKSLSSARRRARAALVAAGH